MESYKVFTFGAAPFVKGDFHDLTITSGDYVMLIIDTHAHVYSPDEKRYPPIEKPLRPPGGKASVEDLQPRVARMASKQFARSKPVPSIVLTIATSATARAPIRTGLRAYARSIRTTRTVRLVQQFVRDYRIRGMRSIPAKNGQLNHAGVRALWKTGLEQGIVISADRS